MIDAKVFRDELAHRSVGFWTGVPCSFFQGPIGLLERSGDRYVPAANEGAALAMAAGAELAGTRAVVMLQNSGFGNLLNPLTSLIMTFDIPVLVFMSLRGWPDPDRDEPQHRVMGSRQHALLDALGVDTWTMPADEDGFRAVLDEAEHSRREGRPAVVLVPKNSVGTVPATAAVPAPTAGDTPAAGDATGGFDRRAALAALAPHLGDAAVYATTGYISRELHSLAHRPENFYMQGSMGHALSLGIGTALSRPTRRVVVVDGDGAALMHLGSAAVAGAAAPGNLTHVVLDNGCYESTGGQHAPASVDWAGLGRALGYRTAGTAASAEETGAAMRRVRDLPGPHLLAVTVSPGTDVPPRVTSRRTPAELRRDFEAALARDRTRDGTTYGG
ncbi:phosphonopyruvate decarboxylase [Streptomyces tagetis]|uniref:Phosphonopyruvate decarboxylase n=1 Tax=Streptomyces tagetis TaxID=2820809 RepID=A0A940XB84_9ACTN|nr:phosphonopyruvate decarboxylase [Streptomyces sp. RG38]MBQ0825165.1 phosphonopyruvate decarboxylase [Streptomyces sp. RG38]